jgi:uncharacterized protein (DUF885 family)
MNRSPTPLLSRLGRGAALLCLALHGCRPQPPARPTAPPTEQPAAPSTEDIASAILDAWLAAQPVTATSLGEHAHDARWPDVSENGIAADRRRIADALAQIEGIDASALPLDARIDLDILKNELRLQEFVHEVEMPWKRDPMWYAGLIGSGLEDLVSRDFAPLTERAASAVGRLEALPAFVDQAIANLQPGATLGPHTAVAVDQLEGVVVLVDEVLPARLAGARPDDVAKIEAAKGPAIEAVRRLQTKVRDELLPAATDDWRLGPEAYARKLELTLQTDLSADELRRTAILEHARVRGQMAALADDLAEVLFAPRKLHRLRAGEGDSEARLVRAVLEELAADHVSPPRLRDRIEANLQRLEAFVREKGLVTMNDAEVLEVIWTPPHQRGVFIAGLAAPGPLDAGKAGLPSFYLVQPVPESWSSDVRESFLREYNNFMIEVLSIHEAIPGHFVQLYYAKREPSKVRRVLANGAFVEGWAVYAERFMVEAGYAGARPDPGQERPASVSKKLWDVMQDDELRRKAIELHALKFYLRSVTNAILDQSVHAGQMDELEALELMVDRSYQQEGEARAKWIRAQVTSTQLSTYFVGAQAWLRLRAEAEKRPGFQLGAFHDAALSHGAPPVPWLREFLFTADAPAEATPAAAPTEPSAPADSADSGGPAEPATEGSPP